MEVRLLDAQGIPDGALLSVRVGTTRRQAAVERGAFRLDFPKAIAVSSPVKVDVLAPLGSSTFTMKSGIEDYPLLMPANDGRGNIAMRLRMNKLSGKGEPQVKDGTSAAARGYMEQHNLMAWVHDMIEGLITDTPKNPWSYIEKHLAKTRTDKPASQLDCAAKQETIHDTRMQVKSVLLEATRSGDLEAALSKGGGAQRRVAGALQAAAATGRLAAALRKRMVPTQQRVRDVLESSLADGSLEKTCLTWKGMARERVMRAFLESDTSGHLEAKAADLPWSHVARTMKNAAANGRLYEALQARREAARACVSDGLKLAALDGSLQIALSKRHEKPQEHVSRALRITAANGKLQQALGSRRAAAIERVRSGLQQAAASGRLQVAVSKIREPAQPHVARALRVATNSGRLQEVLRNRREAAIQRVTSGLQKAATDGRLELALSKFREAPKAHVARVLRKATVSGALRDALRRKQEAARLRVSRGLLEAAVSGRLQIAVSKIREKPQQHIARALKCACSTGLLQDVMAKRRQAALQRVRVALPQATADGRLAKAIGRLRGTPVQRVGASLEKALREGRLAPAIQKSKEQCAKSFFMKKPSIGTWLMPVLPPEQDALDQLKLQAQAVLMRASADGRLENALRQASVRQPREAMFDVSKILEDQRADIRNMFFAASVDGRLQEALEEASAKHRAPDEAETKMSAEMKAEMAVFKDQMTAMRDEAKQQLHELRSEAKAARRELQDLYSTAKHEISTLGESANDVKNDLKLLTQTVRELLLGSRNEELNRPSSADKVARSVVDSDPKLQPPQKEARSVAKQPCMQKRPSVGTWSMPLHHAAMGKPATPVPKPVQAVAPQPASRLASVGTWSMPLRPNQVPSVPPAPKKEAPAGVKQLASVGTWSMPLANRSAASNPPAPQAQKPEGQKQREFKYMFSVGTWHQPFHAEVQHAEEEAQKAPEMPPMTPAKKPALPTASDKPAKTMQDLSSPAKATKGLQDITVSTIADSPSMLSMSTISGSSWTSPLRGEDTLQRAAGAPLPALVRTPQARSRPSSRQKSVPALGTCHADGNLTLLPLTPEMAELEQKIVARNNRFRKENDALRRENVRLKKLREAKAAGDDRYRKELERISALKGSHSTPSL
eukprot:TRINITY_DN122208_c0_g1_i1.p1 TRINITY_DN122208_c0_g1~~TRINITY_DN122208_c0_g1_i1.p1  ORF type:complete len:1134 (+),score=327.81 TRINITY_DN122208_c0_g1_i1:69-3470(+)